MHSPFLIALRSRCFYFYRCVAAAGFCCISLEAAPSPSTRALHVVRWWTQVWSWSRCCGAILVAFHSDIPSVTAVAGRTVPPAGIGDSTGGCCFPVVGLCHVGYQVVEGWRARGVRRERVTQTLGWWVDTHNTWSLKVCYLHGGGYTW